MTDISKCLGEYCSIADYCFRFTAPASDVQSWLLVSREEQGQGCPEYLPSRRPYPYPPSECPE